MSENTANIKRKHILYCDCGGERIQPEIKNTVERLLQSAPVKVTVLSDLCGLSALNKDKMPDLLPDSETMVMGCYKRSMKLLFNLIRDNYLPENTEHLNLIEEDTNSITVRIENFIKGSSGSKIYNKITLDSDWPSWYPVIDVERCTACGQCADFCLFGVYEKTFDQVRVINPQGCKNNCPACARICPQTAIIFPKYRQGGAIGGSEQIDETAEQERLTNDIQSILGGDIYSALERRKLKRRSIILDETMRKAQEERKSALRESKN